MILSNFSVYVPTNLPLSAKLTHVDLSSLEIQLDSIIQLVNSCSELQQLVLLNCSKIKSFEDEFKLYKVNDISKSIEAVVLPSGKNFLSQKFLRIIP